MDEVPSLSIVRSSIPDEVEDAVLRSLEKVPADRFATAADFASALHACQGSGMHTARRTGHRTRQRSRPPQRNWKAIIPTAIVALLVVSGATWAGRSLIWGSRMRAFGATPTAGGLSLQRIAVLYFKDQSPDKKLGYLADGLTESLIKDLSQVPALDVVTISGVKQFAGKDIPPDSIANALDAGTLVEGIVEPEGNRARVSFRLVDGNSGDTYQRASVVEALGDPLALKAKLADEVARMLRPWVRQEIRLRESRAATKNPMAWSLVQRASKLRKDADGLDQAGNTDGALQQLTVADTLLAQAEALDPTWPEPIVARGQVAARREKLTRDPGEAMKWIDVGMTHAERAIKLDPQNADAFELRGTLRIRPVARGLIDDQRKIRELVQAAEPDLRAAIRFNPTQANALYVLSQIQYLNHDVIESANLAQRAYEADAYLTAAPDILWRLYVTSYDSESFARAQKWCDEFKSRFPQHFLAARCQLWIMTAKGVSSDPAEAWRRAEAFANAAPPQLREVAKREGQIVVADVLGREADKLGSAGNSSARAALLDSARRVLVRARTGVDRTIDPRGDLVGWEAFVRAQLGDKREAVELIQKYLTDHPEHRAGFSKVNPWWWRPLQDDARFKSLIATG